MKEHLSSHAGDTQHGKHHPAAGYNQLVGYNDLIQGLATPAYQCDLQGHIIRYNKAAVDLWGKTPIADSDLWGASLQVKDADGNVMRMNAHPMLLAVQQKTAQPAKELELLRLDGSTRYVLAHASPVFNELGAVSGALNIVVDISAYRKKNETREPQMAQVSVQELSLKQLAIENALEGIVITDALAEHNPIIYVNHAFTVNTGYSAAEVIGKNCRLLQGPDSDKDVVGTIRKKLGEKKLFRGDILNYKKDGTPFWNELSIVPIANAQGIVTNFVGFQNDVTERKLSEEKISTTHESLEVKVKKRTAQLEDVNKELEAFNYSVSHDLQAPLRTISGFSRILLKDYGDRLDMEAREHLEYIEKSVRQMKTLIKSLLSFSKIGKADLSYTNVDIDTQVTQVIEELKAGKGSHAPEIILHGLHPALCDADLMKQVWTNLISNAIKYSSKKEHPMIEIGMANSNSEVVYYIRDNGTGFNMAEADKIFSPFQRLHSNSEFEGTGVGLATVHRIITKHGGRIWADARISEGATFYFTLKGTLKHFN